MLFRGGIKQTMVPPPRKQIGQLETKVDMSHNHQNERHLARHVVRLVRRLNTNRPASRRKPPSSRWRFGIGRRQKVGREATAATRQIKGSL
jgi:hypothetical protein